MLFRSGGGCSPSLSRELVFFTDNLETVSLMAVDIRTGEVAASHPVIDELPANMPVSVENSAIVYDHGNGRVSTIVCNWFGAGSPNLAKPDSDSSIQSYENIYDRNWLLKGNCMIMPGVERVDTIRTADGWTMKSVWCRSDLSDTSMMKLSTATGYIYGFVQDVDSGMWQYIVLDFDTGKTVLTVDVASLYGYNNMAIGMYAGRDGNKLYCPTGYKELLRLQDRFVFLPEMPYRKVDLDKTSRRVLSAAEFQAAGGAGTPASWLHTATLDNLHENLFWAFIYNIIGIPLAAGLFIPFGLTLNPMFGAAAMSLSSFCVVSNALRLNLFDLHSTRHDHKTASPAAAPVQSAAENNKKSDAEAPEVKTEDNTMKKTLKVEGMIDRKSVV